MTMPAAAAMLPSTSSSASASPSSPVASSLSVASPMVVLQNGELTVAGTALNQPSTNGGSSAAALNADEMMPYYEQVGSVVVGPGAKKEAMLLGLGLPRLSSRQHDELARSKKYAMEQSIKHVLMKQTVQHQQQQQKVAMYAQALSLMARVYIGSISFELREDTIKNAFAPFGPIKSINMSWDPVTGHHKGFAFLEYEVPEAATLAQEQMNGVLIGGRNVKVPIGNNVGRPSNMPQAQPIIEMIMEEAKQYNRIYVSSIHPDLVEQDIKSVFEAFGRIINVDLPKGALQGKHKGYAYIDYDSPKAAADAVASMNLFDLGGQFLRVGRAITPPQAQQYIVPSSNSTLPTAAAVAAAAVTAKIQAMEVASPVTTVKTAVTPPPAVIIPSQSVRSISPQASGPVFVVPPPGVAIPQISSPRLFTTPDSSTTSEGGESPQIAKLSRQSSAVDVSSGVPVANVESKPEVEAGAAEHAIVGENSPINVQPQNAQRLLQNTSSNEQRQQQQLVDLETGQTLASQEDFKIKGNEARNILMHKLMRRQESSVLVLLNMVGAEDIDEYLQDEVTEECSKYGHVEQVIIYQEKQGEEENAPIIVKIFVKYSLPKEAQKAKETFNGRYFSGRQIKAELYDQMLFDHNDLSG